MARFVARVGEALSLIVRRLGARGFDPVQFHHFHGARNPLLLNLDSAERASLFEHDLVELIVKMFEMREMGFNLFKPFGELLVHQESVRGIVAGGQPEAVQRSLVRGIRAHNKRFCLNGFSSVLSICQ